MPRWQQHKIILPDGDILSLCSISDCGAALAEYCAASITVSWRGKKSWLVSLGQSYRYTPKPRPFRASPADLDGPQRER